MRAVAQSVLAVAVVSMTVTGGSTAFDPAVSVGPLDSAVRSIEPTDGAVVGIAHPIVVTFGKPITNRLAAERAIEIKSTPAMSGRYEWLDDLTVQWTPDQFWPAHSTVMLSAGRRMLEFKTGPAVVGVADISDHTFTVTVDGVATGLPAPHHLPHAGEDGVMLASMGRPQYPTPVGTYSVLGKERSVLMDSSSVGIPVNSPDGYLLDVEYAVRITRRGLFVHSAPWAVPVMGVDNVSHGCISLIPAAAEWYYNTANVGDPVIVQE